MVKNLRRFDLRENFYLDQSERKSTHAQFLAKLSRHKNGRKLKICDLMRGTAISEPFLCELHEQEGPNNCEGNNRDSNFFLLSQELGQKRGRALYVCRTLFNF